MNKQSAAALLAVTATLMVVESGCKRASSQSQLSLTSTQAAKPADSIVATVNGEPIAEQQFYEALQAYQPPFKSSAATEAVGDTVLRKLIQNAIIGQIAHSEGVYPSTQQVDDQFNTFAIVDESTSTKPLADQLQAACMSPEVFKSLRIVPNLCETNVLAKGITIPESKVRAFYDLHRLDMFTRPRRAHIKSMVLRNQADAEDAYKQIQHGASFETVYAQRSIERALPEGDMRQWFPLAGTPQPLAPAVSEIELTDPGQITHPIHLHGVWWIIKVVEKRDMEVLPYDAVKTFIGQDLLQKEIDASPARKSKLRKEVQAKVAASTISVSEPHYKHIVDEVKSLRRVPGEAG